MRPLRIGSYHEIPSNDDQLPLFTWKDFYGFRNQVIRLLRNFGTAGPMGEVDFSVAEEDQPSFDSEVIDYPDFFVVDDMYNEYDRIVRVECSRHHVSAVLIASLAAMMEKFPGWSVSFGLSDSGMVVSFDAVLLGGRRFWDCDSIEQISQRCQNLIDFGAAEELPEPMNQLWRDLIMGSISPTMQFPHAPSRQWTEMIRSLEAIRSRRKDAKLSSFTYDQVRFDLHPLTRLELLRRILADLPTFSREQLAAMKRNLQKDIGHALADSVSPKDARELVMETWLSLERVRASFGPTEIVNWWADVLHDFDKSSPSLREAVEDGLRERVAALDDLFQLSALFGLAKLGANDISLLVKAAMEKRSEWLNNSSLIQWLLNLKATKCRYPDREIFNKYE